MQFTTFRYHYCWCETDSEIGLTSISLTAALAVFSTLAVTSALLTLSTGF